MIRWLGLWYDRTDHFETQCASWAALRLSQNLIELTGEARYGDWIERLAYNAVNASLPMTPEGNVLYYSNYNIHGAMKQNRGLPEWTCCTGTRPLDVVQYHLSTFYHDDKNIYVNLFTPSTVTWEHHQNPVTLTQHTDFPYSEKIDLTVSARNSDEFGIGVRVPEWIAGHYHGASQWRACRR